MAFFNNQDSANPSAYLYFWPFDASSTGAERMTALALSDNSTPQSGTGSLTWSSGASTTLSLSGSCTADVNCLTDQLVPGDALTLTGTGCSGSATVTTASDLGSAHQLTINGTVTANFGSGCTAPSGFTYTGYFVTPAHDQTPAPSVTGCPGGALSLTAHYNSTVGYYTGGLIWAIVPNQVSVPDTTNRGIGAIYAYAALPNSSDQLAADWKNSSSDVWCSSSFARPTIVNGKVYVPTYAFSTTGLPINPSSGNPCPSGSGVTTPLASGILVYY